MISADASAQLKVESIYWQSVSEGVKKAEEPRCENRQECGTFVLTSMIDGSQLSLKWNVIKKSQRRWSGRGVRHEVRKKGAHKCTLA